MNFQELFYKADTADMETFRNWVDYLTPEQLSRVELYLRRQHLTPDGPEKTLKADIVEDAGIRNCGEDYYTYPLG